MEQRIIYKTVKKEFRFTEDDKIFEKLIGLIDETLGARCDTHFYLDKNQICRIDGREHFINLSDMKKIGKFVKDNFGEDNAFKFECTRTSAYMDVYEFNK